MNVVNLEGAGPNIVRGLYNALEIFSRQVGDYIDEYGEDDDAPADMVDSLNGIVKNLGEHIEMDFNGFISEVDFITVGGINRKTSQLLALLKGACQF